MTYNKSSAKTLLENAIRVSKPQGKNEVTDPFERAIGRRIEGRGITEVPGSRESQPVEDPWARLDKYIATRDRLEVERKEHEALSSSKLTTAEVIWNELGHRSTDIPLNGAGVIRAALAGLGQGRSTF